MASEKKGGADVDYDGVSFGTVPEPAEAERSGAARRPDWAPDNHLHDDDFKSGNEGLGGNQVLETSIHDPVVIRSGGSSSIGDESNGIRTSSLENTTNIPAQICNVITKLLPTLCLTCVIQFIDLLAGVSFYLIALVIFQVIFWPSLSYVMYSKFVRKRSELFRPIAKFSNGHWIHFFLLQVHATLVVGAVLLQILSIQYLDVTVSLAMSFLPVIILILIEHITATKACNVELLISLVVGYSGVVCAAMPALLATHPYIQWLIYSGIAASIGSSLLTIQASLLLQYFRRRQTDDSLLTLSIGLKGSIISLVAGLSRDALGPVDSSNSGYIAAIVSFGTLAAFLLIFKLNPSKGIKVVLPPTDTESSSQETSSVQPFPLGYTSVLQLRVLVFVFSLLWGICKQFHRHIYPSVFSVLGVILISCAFLLAIAYREWYAMVNSREEDERHRDRKSNMASFGIFKAIPWLFSGRPVLYIR